MRRTWDNRRRRLLSIIYIRAATRVAVSVSVPERVHCRILYPNWGQLTLDLPDSGPIQVVGCRHTPNWSVNRVILFQFWPLPTPRSWTPRAHGAGRAWQLFYCILRGTICVSMERAASKVPVVRTKERRKEGRKEGSTSGSKEEERTKESYEFWRSKKLISKAKTNPPPPTPACKHYTHSI